MIAPTAGGTADNVLTPAVGRLTLLDAARNIEVVAHRNLLKFYRNRQLLLLSIVQPLTNMMLFAYVFNNVAKVPGVPYREYVIPGVLIQAVMVAAMRTGVAVSHDAAKTWVFLPNLPVGLFYHVSYDMATPFNVCGGMQDNYDWCGPSAVRGAAGIANYHWTTVQGGDGFVALQDPADYRVAYSESQDGNMMRLDRVTNESISIRPQPAPARERAMRKTTPAKSRRPRARPCSRSPANPSRRCSPPRPSSPARSVRPPGAPAPPR